ncbi:MAG TPA: PAS domain-containing protein [Bacteroidia bacterium]
MKDIFPFFKSLRRGQPLAIGILTFMLTLVLTQTLSLMRHKIKRSDEQKKLQNSLVSAADRLQEQINQSLAATKTLNYLIENYGVPGNFGKVGKELIKSNPLIQAIEVVEKGIITKVHPLEGNEVVLGYDILKDSTRNIEALEAIKRRDIYFAGPLSLKQGGIGVIGRLPIFKNDKFVGFSASIILLDSLLSYSGILPSFEPDIEFQLSKRNPNTKQLEYFIKNTDTGFAPENSVRLKVQDGDWILQVRPKDSYSVYSIIPFALMGFLLAVISGFFAWYISRQPLLLKQLVEHKMNLLNENERLLSITQETAKVGSWMFDVKERQLKVNDMAMYIFNIKEREGITLEKMLDRLTNDSYKTELKSALEKSMRTGQEFDVDVKLSLQDGSFKWLRVTGKGVIENKRCVRIYGAIQDIHSHKMSETERVDILDSIKDAFIAVDENFVVTYWNKAAEHMFNLKAEHVMGKVLDDTGIMSVKGDLGEALKSALSSHASRSLEYYFEKTDIWTELSIYPKYQGLTIYLRDVTVHHQHVEAIKSQNKQMREIAWMQSHVVRAPLARLMGAVDLLNIDKTEPNKEKFIYLINQSANELDGLIKDISQKTVVFKDEENGF